MWNQLRSTVVIFTAITLCTGIVYPLAVLGIAQTFFPFQAQGSLIRRDGHVVGSILIGQSFNQAIYFHARPSAAGSDGYDAVHSNGSNLGPTSKILINTMSERTQMALQEDGGRGLVPIDLVTSSASGLDPHITPAGAFYQVARVAQARGITQDALHALVTRYTEYRSLGMLGEPRVNVLSLNLALDELYPQKH